MNNHESEVLSKEVRPWLSKNFICQKCESLNYEIDFHDDMGYTSQSIVCSNCGHYLDLNKGETREKIATLWSEKKGIFGKEKALENSKKNEAELSQYKNLVQKIKFFM